MGWDWGDLTDVPGVRVGHAHRIGGGWLTGVTVVVPPPGTVAAVDVRGGGPGTHETDALDPTTLVPTVDAVVLTGGSAYGLVSAHGVQRWCEEQGRGFPVGPPDDRGAVVVPIVPAAAVFDLGRGGDPAARPDADMGYAAALAASATAAGDRTPRGAVGAGTGALLGQGRLKGGVGTASLRLGSDVDLVVGAIAVVNAFGSPVDPTTGALLGTAFVPPGLERPVRPRGGPTATGPDIGGLAVPPPANTTLAVVATNAALDPARARRTATAAHAGLARAMHPAHTVLDGDTVFVLATGEVPVETPEQLVRLQAMAADVVTLAVLDAVLSSRTTTTAGGEIPGYLDAYPSAEPPGAGG